MFDYYTESNCKLECAWAKAEEICGCKPWHVPAVDGSEICFVLGNVCFDQIMRKIKDEDIKLNCGCEKDCVYSRYTIALEDRKIFERTSPNVYWDGSYNLGTNQLLGTDFSQTRYHNMGRFS